MRNKIIAALCLVGLVSTAVLGATSNKAAADDVVGVCRADGRTETNMCYTKYDWCVLNTGVSIGTPCVCCAPDGGCTGGVAK